MNIRTNFPIQDYFDESKTTIAQGLANWMVENDITVPVFMDKKGSRQIFFRYIDEKGYWEEINKKKIRTMAKDQIGQSWTRHTKQEFLNQLTSHEDFIHYEDMGLDCNEVLTRNGIVYNLDTGELRNIEKRDYALNMIDADPENEDVDISKFLDFLENTLPKEDHRKTFQEYLGWSIKYPDGSYEKLLLILGETDSGKSTLLKIVSKLFEEAQTSNVSLTQLAHGRAFHVNHMAKSILNIDQDMSSAKLQSSSRLKKLISQEELFVEPKKESGFNINPKSNMMVASNVAPNPEEASDNALYNRFLTLEAPDTVPKEEQDKELVDKLTTDEMLSGIFHWAVEGLKRLESQGSFTYSPSIIETRKKWDEYGTNIHKFLSECVEIEQGSNVPTTDMYEVYELWAMERMGETVGKKEFISEVADHPNMSKQRKTTKGGTRRMCFSNVKVSSEDLELG